MQRLTEREHWDSLYRQKSSGKNSLKSKLKYLTIKIFGKYILNYSDYFLWEVLFKKYLPKTKELKVLEVGSAPGTTLVRFHNTYGFEPYGVEYSDEGAALNRASFASNNIDTNNVIQADFFSDNFQNQYKQFFDIVISVGFIEHFTEVEDVINKHQNLLKKGGYLIIIIPNLRGINGTFVNFFNKKVMAMHNTDIMQKNEFIKLFNKEYLSTIYCDYYGTFNFGLFNTQKKSLLRYLLSFCKMSQVFLNIFFHLLFRDKGAESRLLSPYLIYIGSYKPVS